MNRKGLAASSTPIITAVVIAAIVLLLGGFWGVSSINSNLELSRANALTAEDVEGAVAGIVLPAAATPAEIAAEINIPGLRVNNLDDILEGVYPDLVDELEEDCYQELWDEFNDDVTDEVEDLIEADIGEDVAEVEVVDYNWNNEYNFNVINLGLDHDEDREAEISSTLRVRYVEEFGDEDDHFAKVRTTATCSDWDNDDEEFDDLSVDYRLD